MRRLMTKLLACCLVFALALTMCAGAFSVSAASTGTLTVGEVTVNAATTNTGAVSAVVPVTLATEGENGYAMATYTITVPAALQAITDVAVVCDSEANPAVVSYLDAEGNVVSVAAGANSATAPAIDAAGNINFKVDCTDIELAGPKSITVNITFDLTALDDNAATLCDVYEITVAEVVAGDNNAEYIDVTADEGSVTVNNLILQAKNALFQSSYSLAYAVRKDLVDTYGAKLEVVTAAGTSYVEVDADTAVQNVRGYQCYLFMVEDIPARKVADVITVTIKTDDYDGETADYNLVSYALNQITGNTSVNQKKAMAAFLEYAAAAQVRFNYNTGNPADANIPAEYKNATEVVLSDESTPKDATKAVYINQFNVAYTAQVQIAAAISGDATGCKVRFAYNDKGTVIVDAELTTVNNVPAAICDKIAVKDMVRKVDISIIDANGNVLDTRTYSFLSYAYTMDVNSKKAGATDTTIKNAAASLALVKFAKAFAISKNVAVNF